MSDTPAYLFPPKPKNRRLTPKELEWDKEVATVFKRPLRTFVNDTPFYPYCVPEPRVNFNLGWKY